MTDEKKKDFTRRISQANSTEMVVILYDITLEYVEDARAAYAQKDQVALRKALSSAKRCIGELLASLNMDYAPSGELFSLYRYCIRQITICEVRGEVELLEEIDKIIKPLRDSYADIVSYNPGGCVMANSQQVFAGLTYGRNLCSESITGMDYNRGYCV